jgi:hypothetical protein
MLTQLHSDLWTCAVPYRAMGLWLGRQLIVVRLPSGGLWVHSPIPWSADLRRELATLGPVEHVVGPNRLHDECLREFQAEYPAAVFHAAPGLAAARRDLRFAPEPLGNTPPPAWSGSLDPLLIAGMPALNEVVFLHRASRSLIIADIAFNLGPPAPVLTQLGLRLSRAWNRFTPSITCKLLMRDRRAVRASINHILAWDFDRILVGHGKNVHSGGRSALRDAFTFLSS